MRRPYCYLLSFVLLLLLAGAFPIQGQNNASLNWYFGSSDKGIRFNRGTNTVTLANNPAATFGNGGAAVASDPINGNLLFFTDGSTIYDASGAAMPNGSGLSGNPSGNQPAVIAAVPGQPNQYFVFTNTADFNTGGDIFLTTVDMSLPGNGGNPAPPPPLGDVSTANVPIPTLTNRSEAMILVPHANGADYWLITHENGTANYTVSLIDETGVVTSTNYQNEGFAMSAGNFAYNASSGQIAVSPQSANVGVHIMNFDNSTGELEFDQVVPNTAVASTTGQAIYDVEWSSNGQYLYISVAGEPGIPADILQFDTQNPSATLTSVLPNSIANSYGLQMGPDSVIYHLYRETAGGPILLGALSNTDTVASAVTYDPSVFAGDFGGTQFPSFLPGSSQEITVDFTSSGQCANSPVSFFPEVDPAADSLVWNFGDGTGANQWSPNHIYENGGPFTVTLTAYLNGESQTVQHDINITQFDLQIDLVQDTTACSCELPFPKAPNPKPNCGQFSVTATVQGGSGNAIWSNGQTGFTLTPDSAGFYYVVVTDPNTGCSAYAGVNINEYQVQDQRANIWHFGQNAGLDFNPWNTNPPVPIEGPVNSPEGVATISDRNGQVIFSTDGLHIYDKDGNDITPDPNPPGLGGEPTATQSVLIMPVPGDETLYYIFTTQEIYGTGTYELRYSLFDLKLNDGNGGLVEYNQLLFEPSTERITGSGEWLIAHEYGNNTFRAYRISPDGISSPVISGAGSDHPTSSPEAGQGYMKLGPGNKLAVALSTPGSNVVEIFDFNDSTGVVSNPQVADLKTSDGQVYGIEFSPGGNKLFATVTGSDSKIVEFAFDSLGNVYFKQSVDRPGEELGAIQIGPNGQLYMAVNGQPFLYNITANEDTASLSPLTNLQQFALAGGTTSTLGLPNFIQNISTPIQGPSISVTGTCLGSPTEFEGAGRDPNIEYYSWNFGDGEGTPFDTNPTAEHEYAAAGTYQVALTLRNRCDIDTVLFTTVVITAPPDSTVSVLGGAFPTLCDGPLTILAEANDPGLTYAWSTGDSTRQIDVDRQGIYTVTITNAAGCTSSGSMLVADNRPIVELGPDLTLCQDASTPPLDAQNPGATYQWAIDGVNAGTGRTQNVDTATPGVFEYTVAVTDPITSCTITDSVTYTINQSPLFTATPFNPTTCGAADGRIELNIDAPASNLFTYSVTGLSTAITVSDQAANPSPGAPYTATPLDAGTYGVTVTDQLSGCAVTTTASINDPGFTVTATPLGTCDPMVLQVSTSPLQNPVNYRVIDNATAQVVDSGTDQPDNFSTLPVPSDNRTYVVEVTSKASGCTVSSPLVDVNHGPTVPIDVTADVCSNPITIAVSGGDNWSWSGPDIQSGASAATMTATPPQGPVTYDLHVEQSGFCALDTAITVTVDNAIVPSLSQSSACDDQVTITATPSGSFLYRWSRNGNPDATLAGPQVIATDANDGDSYTVQIYNPVTGCTPTSPPLVVSVIGSLELDLDVGLACEGSPFTITGTTNVPVATYEWSYEGAVIGGETSSTLEDTREGTYEARVSISGCETEESIVVALSPVTPGSLPSGATICNDPANADETTRQVELDPGTGFTSYAWFKDDVPLGVTDQVYTATEPGTYRVDLVNMVGCASSDQTIVEVECLPKIVVPNAFRPGPGARNPEFYALTYFIDDTDFEVLIFSRWGELIFQSTNREFRWNGGYNNNPSKPLPPGTYAYVIKYKSSYQPERGVQEKRGGVVLLR